MALTTNLVSYWKLDESSGDASDSVGSNTLTNFNSMTYAPAVINNGAVCSPTGPKYLSILNSAQTGLGITGAFSMSFWVNISTAPTSPNRFLLMGKERDAAGEGVYVFYYINNGGTLALEWDMRGGSGSNTHYEGSYNVNLGTSTWHYLVWTHDGSTFKDNIYIDGTNVVVDYAGTTNATTNNDPFGLGGSAAAYSGTVTLDGSLDEAGIWSRVLTQAEVTTLYNGGAGLQYPFVSPANGNFLAFF